MEFRPSAVLVPRPKSQLDGSVVKAPWADLPKEIQGGCRSLSNCDYCPRVTYDRSTPPLSSDELKRQWIAELRRRKELEDQKASATVRAHSRLLDELVETKYTPVERVVAFDHRGKMERSVSAPADQFYARLDEISAQEQVRRANVPPIPTDTVTVTPSMADEFGNIHFWYPNDKQRLKFRMLEEARLGVWKEDLVSHGWQAECPPGGADKRIGCLDGSATLTPEQETAVREQMEQWIAEQQSIARQEKEREDKIVAEAKQAAAAGEREGAADPLQATGDSLGRLPRDAMGTQQSVAASISVSLSERTAPFKPPRLFRPELPASGLPMKLQLPKGSLSASPAPPWGRQTDDEERWKKRAQYALSVLKEEEEGLLAREGTTSSSVGGGRRSILRPITKSDIDRELKVVRDGGLLKRPKKSVLHAMSAETLSFVRSLPKDFGKSNASKAMRAVPHPGAATLKL